MSKLALLLTAVAILGASTTVQSAERKERVTVLEVVSNIPKQPLGLQVLILKPDKFGYFVSAKTGFNDRTRSENYFAGIDREIAEAAGDILEESSSNWISVSVGPTRRLFESVYIHAGAGFAIETEFLRFFRPLAPGGVGAEYWISDGDSFTVNVTSGLDIRATNHIFFSVGADLNPAGVNVGVGFGF